MLVLSDNCFYFSHLQVYVKGELVGGLDIIKELQASGELLGTLKGE